ncbi:MAG TPA: DUF4870 domain-containing protein [Thermosynechococcaceae cyanobacterium]
MIDQNDRTTAMWCHLSSLVWIASLTVGLPIPFGSVLIPLIIWSSNRDKPFVDAHGKESLNFHISLILYSIVIIGVMIVLAIAGFALFATQPESAASAFFAVGGSLLLLIALLIGIGLAIFDFIATIIAAVRASNGEVYRYPFAIRLLK